MVRRMGKVYEDITAALDGMLFDGMTIMVGGFGLCGIPENAISHISKAGVKSLTIISNNCGVEGFGLDALLENGQIKKWIGSYIGGNENAIRKYIDGSIQVELIPQGTLAERIRAGGAGIKGFYTRTGVGTVVEEGKEVRIFDGQKYLLEFGLKADLAIVKGYTADHEGNIVYRKTSRNFNPLMATAADKTVVEVEKLVEVGNINPDHIHTPGIYVDRLIEAEFKKDIEFVTTSE
jgi:3-oxoacid CoA-transferase subunit A